MIAPRTTAYRIYAEGFHTFWGAYCAYKTECAEYGRNWNDDTLELYETIITSRIIPRLPRHDTTPIQDYRKSDYLKVIKDIEKAGKNNNPRNPIPYEEGTLEKYLHIIKTVVTVASERDFFRNVFECELDPLPKTSPNRIKRMRRLWMTPKSLSVNQEIKVANYLRTLLPKRGEAVALFLMYALGLRNAEACGVNFGNVHQMKAYPDCYFLMIPQTTANHTNQVKIGGKTYNMGRNIPLPSLVVKFLFQLKEQRLSVLQEHPDHSISEIDNMPIAYRKGDMFTRCGADDVTAQAKKMFIELGMREKINDIGQHLQQDYSAALEEQEDLDEFSLIEKDPTAYLLRRNFATHLAILQLSAAEIAYVIGHALEEAKRSDFLDEQKLYTIKKKMDERPILNTILSVPTNLPAVDITQKFDRYSQEFIIPGNTSRIQLSVTAKEPDDNLTVSTLFADSSILTRTETCIRRTPYPPSFDGADVLKYYHEAFQRAENNPDQ